VCARRFPRTRTPTGAEGRSFRFPTHGSSGRRAPVPPRVPGVRRASLLRIPENDTALTCVSHGPPRSRSLCERAEVHRLLRGSSSFGVALDERANSSAQPRRPRDDCRPSTKSAIARAVEMKFTSSFRIEDCTSPRTRAPPRWNWGAPPGTAVGGNEMSDLCAGGVRVGKTPVRNDELIPRITRGHRQSHHDAESCFRQRRFSFCKRAQSRGAQSHSRFVLHRSVRRLDVGLSRQSVPTTT